MKNLYQLYTENGNRAGFKVRRGSWAQSSWARVIGVTTENLESGQLPGTAPYHGNPAVFIDFLDKGEVSQAPCAGNYSWEIFDPEKSTS